VGSTPSGIHTRGCIFSTAGFPKGLTFLSPGAPLGEEFGKPLVKNFPL